MGSVQTYSERLGGHIQYTLSDCFIEHITINDKRLFFPKYDSTKTVGDIMNQYADLNEGKTLNLINERLIISPSMPLDEITSILEQVQVFQKILNNIHNQMQPENLLNRTEQHIASKIFKKVIKHNEKREEIKFFEKHSLIRVRDRPEIKHQFQYQIKQTTLIMDLIKQIDRMAGYLLKPDSIATQSGNIYTENQFNKTFQQLNLRNQLFIVNYPPILNIDDGHTFIIKLTNSTFPQQTIQISVNKRQNILGMLKTVELLTDEIETPIAVKDSEGNYIQKQKWMIDIRDLMIRRSEFEVIYTPFIDYECQIFVMNLPKGPLNFTYLIKKGTNLKDIANKIKQKSGQNCINYEVSNSSGQIYQHQIRDKSLSSLHIYAKLLKFMYIYPICLINSNTKLITKNPKNQNYLERTAQQIFSFGNSTQILCLNQQTKQPQFAIASADKQIQIITKLCQLLIKVQDQILRVQCSEQQTFLTEKFQWKPASSLLKDQKLVVIKKDLKTVFIGQIIDKTDVQVNSQYYSIEVKTHHNFFANRVLVHNDEAINLKAYFYCKDKKGTHEIVKCYNEQRFNDIQLFKGKILSFGGHTLDNNKTLGDYQVSNFQTLFVYDQGQIPQSKVCIISTWRQGNFEASEITENLKQKWTKEYLGLRQTKIFELNQEEIVSSNINHPNHLLIAPKITLQKLHFTQQIISQYKEFQEEIYQSSLKPQILDGNQRQHFLKTMKNTKNTLSQKDSLLIYLYTTNRIHKELNSFLRNDRRKKANYQLKKWYSTASLLMKSLDKLPNIEYVTVYRGISDICIKNAFNRRQNKDKQNYLILNSFNSTSRSKQIAKCFIKGKGALLTIKTRSGKDISSYSHFRDENEVLIPAFVYFLITKFQPDKNPQQMELEQIPFPSTNRKKLIFWVDDNPTNNTDDVKYFQKKKIQVVQVLSTRIMKVLLRDFFGIFMAIGKKIVIISDMKRLQEGNEGKEKKENKEAGVDLFNLIYKEYGMSNKAIIYTQSKQRAQSAIAKRGIKKQHWAVCVNSSELKSQVLKEFAR